MSTSNGSVRKTPRPRRRSFRRPFSLRSSAPNSVVLYYFDEERQALLLVGGDKKGKNEKDFYDRLIQTAETLIRRYRR